MIKDRWLLPKNAKNDNAGQYNVYIYFISDCIMKIPAQYSYSDCVEKCLEEHFEAKSNCRLPTLPSRFIQENLSKEICATGEAINSNNNSHI